MLDKIFAPLCARFGWARTALAVQKRFGELKGNYLAGALALNLFLSLFPLLLVTISIVGFFTKHDTEVPLQLVASFGLSGPVATSVVQALNTAAESARAASVIGLVGSLWSGLGVAAAIEYVIDATWQVAGRGIKDKLRGLGWSAGALLLIILSVGMAAAVDYFAAGLVFGVTSVLLSLVINFLLWMWTFSFLSFRRLPWGAHVPGAVLAAAGLEVVKGLASLVPNLFTGSGAVYGSIGVVFGILASILLLGRIITYASILNVIRWEEKNGTTTIDIEVPKVPGQAPTEADRAGAAQ